MNEQQANQNPSEVFRHNLRRLATAQGVELDGLASSLGFTRDDKKWLRRAWNDGLARPDKRAMPRLEKVADRLGLKSIDDLWNPQAAEDQATVLRSMQNEDEAWQKLVGKIIKYVDAFRLFEAVDPERAKEIESSYGFDRTKMVASLVRQSNGTEEGEQDETAKEILEATAATRAYRDNTSFRIRVSKLLHEYMGWSELNAELASKHGDAAVSQEIDQRLTEVISRPLDEQELADRFYDMYLAQYDESENEGDSLARAFVERLTHHEYWTAFVCKEYDGDEETAQTALAEKWNELQAKSNGAISVKDAVETFCKSYLDIFEPEFEYDEDVDRGELRFPDE